MSTSRLPGGSTEREALTPAPSSHQVVTEAMATGLPVVAAARGGIPEYLGSGGVYVEPSAPEAMADALEPLLLDREHRLRVGSLLRERAQSMTWDVRVREFDQILHEEQR